MQKAGSLTKSHWANAAEGFLWLLSDGGASGVRAKRESGIRFLSKMVGQWLSHPSADGCTCTGTPSHCIIGLNEQYAYSTSPLWERLQVLMGKRVVAKIVSSRGQGCTKRSRDCWRNLWHQTFLGKSIMSQISRNHLTTTLSGNSIGLRLLGKNLDAFSTFANDSLTMKLLSCSSCQWPRTASDS
jgi:hypothetical protein